jgi:hypothetical protein
MPACARVPVLDTEGGLVRLFPPFRGRTRGRRGQSRVRCWPGGTFLDLDTFLLENSVENNLRQIS